MRVRFNKNGIAIGKHETCFPAWWVKFVDDVRGDGTRAAFYRQAVLEKVLAEHTDFAGYLNATEKQRALQAELIGEAPKKIDVTETSYIRIKKDEHATS